MLIVFRKLHQESGARGPAVVNMTKYDKWGWRTTLFNHKHIVPGGVKYTQKNSSTNTFIFKKDTHPSLNIVTARDLVKKRNKSGGKGIEGDYRRY